MAQRLKGIPVMPGLGLGYAVILKSTLPPEIDERILPGDVGEELKKFQDAVNQACRSLEQIRDEAAKKAGDQEAAIFEAQLLMLQDPSLLDLVEQKIRRDLFGAISASRQACEENAAMLSSLEDPYFAARARDVLDVRDHLLRCLMGTPLQKPEITRTVLCLWPMT